MVTRTALESTVTLHKESVQTQRSIESEIMVHSLMYAELNVIHTWEC